MPTIFTSSVALWSKSMWPLFGWLFWLLIITLHPLFLSFPKEFKLYESSGTCETSWSKTGLLAPSTEDTTFTGPHLCDLIDSLLSTWIQPSPSGKVLKQVLLLHICLMHPGSSIQSLDAVLFSFGKRGFLWISWLFLIHDHYSYYQLQNSCNPLQYGRSYRTWKISCSCSALLKNDWPSQK